LSFSGARDPDSIAARDLAALAARKTGQRIAAIEFDPIAAPECGNDCAGTELGLRGTR